MWPPLFLACSVGLSFSLRLRVVSFLLGVDSQMRHTLLHEPTRGRASHLFASFASFRLSVQCFNLYLYPLSPRGVLLFLFSFEMFSFFSFVFCFVFFFFVSFSRFGSFFARVPPPRAVPFYDLD